MPERQRRVAVTELQRKQIRQYAKSNPLSNQVDIANWATREFGRKIGQSTVSETLKARYKYLDDTTFARGYVGTTRQYQADYPLLEKALFEWVLQMEGHALHLNGDRCQPVMGEDARL